MAARKPTRSLCVSADMNPSRWAAGLVIVTVTAVTAAPASGQALPVPATDGPVSALGRIGNRVYLGGAFRYVGPLTGSLAGFDGATGRPDTGMPYVDGPGMAGLGGGGGGGVICGGGPPPAR